MEAFLTSTTYAIQRAIQVKYEVEEQEIAVELIGDSDYRRGHAAPISVLTEPPLRASDNPPSTMRPRPGN